MALRPRRSGSAVAQPKEGCEIATPGETDYQAQASEEYAEVTPPTGAEKGGQTPSPDSGATAEATGSGAPMPGVGECDEIQELSTETER